MANVLEQHATKVTEFFDNWAKFLNKCEKPNKKEYTKLLQACVMGVLVMGVIGYLIKLMFIPINTILLSK